MRSFILLFLPSAPDNEHNRAKREIANADESVVLDGGYDVDVKIACCSAIDAFSLLRSSSVLKKFRSDVVVTGGDGTWKYTKAI